MNMCPPLKIVALALLAFSMSANADCPFPKAPASVPDGKTATEDEMKAAMMDFKTYNAEVTAFGECVDAETKSKSQSMQLKTMQSKKINAAVEELQAKAKLFNEQVRIFKAR